MTSVARLSEWLADHGHDIGDSGKKPEPGSSAGVGSDVFRRFAQSINRAGDSAGASKTSKSSKQIIPVVSEKQYAEKQNEEEIGLAPLEEEKVPDDLDEFVSKSASNTDDITSATADTVSEQPRISLVEEALEQAERQEKFKPLPRALPGEVNPLRPPGYSGPRYGTPTWVYFAAGTGILVLLGVVLAIALNS